MQPSCAGGLASRGDALPARALRKCAWAKGAVTDEPSQAMNLKSSSPEFRRMFAGIAPLQILLDLGALDRAEEKRRPAHDQAQRAREDCAGVSQNTLRAWAEAGKIPVHRNPANGYRLFLRSDLDKYMAKVVASRRPLPNRLKPHRRRKD